MRIKWLLTVWVPAVLTIIIVWLVACAPNAGEELSAPRVEGTIFPLEVVDQAGRTVRVAELPEKIISLAPSNTEILYAIGLGDKLVGVTEYCDYPEEAKQKPQIGGYSTVDIEKVVEIEPDLVLATRIHEGEVIPRLESYGLTVVVLAPKTVEEIIESIDLIGQVTGKGEEASQLTLEMEARVKMITDRTAVLPEEQKPNVFYVLWYDPLTTAGSGSRIHDLIVKAGGNNIAGDLSDYPDISLETVISMNPQVGLKMSTLAGIIGSIK